jgi:3-hydroxyisobutyrate dehydrogenase-like beta-hydroxyacid dehydrogenase
MGAALGSALKPAAAQVIWAADGRSDATAKRAEIADLVAVPDLPELVRRSDVVLAICPPHAALDVAVAVAAAGRPHCYVDANAIAPSTMRRIGELLGPDQVVDGAVIGAPAWEPSDTVLCLSGASAQSIAQLFVGSPFGTRIVGSELGSASAVKACFALYSKALPTVWSVIAAAAEHYGVLSEVRSVLARDGVPIDDELVTLLDRAQAKAWRWAGEMDEIALTLAQAGLPDGHARAAAQVYRSLSGDAPQHDASSR